MSSIRKTKGIGIKGALTEVQSKKKIVQDVIEGDCRRCGNELTKEYYKCSQCDNVFCSEGCLNSHVAYKHKENS